MAGRDGADCTRAGAEDVVKVVVEGFTLAEGADAGRAGAATVAGLGAAATGFGAAATGFGAVATGFGAVVVAFGAVGAAAVVGLVAPGEGGSASGLRLMVAPVSGLLV